MRTACLPKTFFSIYVNRIIDLTSGKPGSLYSIFSVTTENIRDSDQLWSLSLLLQNMNKIFLPLHHYQHEFRNVYGSVSQINVCEQSESRTYSWVIYETF